MIDTDEKFDTLLRASLCGAPLPDTAMQAELRTRLAAGVDSPAGKVISLWWLPALAGGLIALLVCAATFLLVPDTVIFRAVLCLSVITTAASCCLTILGAKRFNLVKEACIIWR